MLLINEIYSWASNQKYRPSSNIIENVFQYLDSQKQSIRLLFTKCAFIYKKNVNVLYFLEQFPVNVKYGFIISKKRYF